MLFVMGMFFQTGHKLPDDLSFEWFDQGERILTNAGKYSYSTGPFRDYVTSTAAHNTVEIDGMTRKLAEAMRYGSAIKDGDGRDVSDSRNGAARGEYKSRALGVV